MEITVDSVNKQTISTKNGDFTKYGIQTKKSDKWLNIVDWDRQYDSNPISPGDTVEITKPEYNEQYENWEADFVDTPGYSDDEQVLHYLENRLIPWVKEIHEEVVENVQDGSVQEDEIDYPDDDDGGITESDIPF